ncbi:MAG: RIP metalloprotease RseP [candidate division WOR-3 bacterium]
MLSSVVLVVLLVSVLIIIHEFGHLAVAKLSHIPVEVFSVGFGPVLIRRRFGETEYRLSAIPLGGFIKMAGEEERAGPGPESPALLGKPGYMDKPLGIRVAVIAAGPLSNLLLGFVLFTVVLGIFGQDYTPATIYAPDGSLAAAVGLRTGDIVRAVAGQSVTDFADLETHLANNAGRTVSLTVERNGDTTMIEYPVPVSYSTSEMPPVVGAVAPGSPAEEAGLTQGDTLIALDGEPVTTWQEFQRRITSGEPRTVVVEWRSRGRHHTAAIQTRPDTALPGAPPRIGVRVDESWVLAQFTGARVGSVRHRSPAANAGIKPGDSLITVGGRPIVRWQDYLEVDAELDGVDSIEVVWTHNGQQMSAWVKPRSRPDQFSRERLGLLHLRHASRLGPLALVAAAATRTGSVMLTIFRIVARAVTGDREAREGIGGPVAVAQITYGAVDWGPHLFLSLWALLSVNLFVVNMLPVPILDGGRILLDCIVAIRRRRLTDRELTWASNIGWLLIGTLVLFTLFNDILRLIRK